MAQTTPDSHRLSILSAEDIEVMYGLPRFNDEDRQLFFSLSLSEREVVDRHTPSVATHLILQLGYFKAKRQFFNYSLENARTDLRHIQLRYFPEVKLVSLRMPSRPTRFSQHQVILKLFNYRNCDSHAKKELEQKAQRVAMISTHPLFILRESLKHLDNQRIVTPTYTFIQDMVGKVVTHERNRITRLLSQSLTPSVKTQLDALLTDDDQINRISALKREPKDFSYTELRREVGRRKLFQPLYEFAKNFLVEADLSNESGRYYASLVKFYTVYKLQRMPPPTTRLYLLCFAFHRFRQINDNLIEAFIHLVGRYEKQAKQSAFEGMQRELIEASNNLKAAGAVLALFVDSSISGDTSFESVKEKAFNLLEPEKFPIVSNYMCKIAFDKTGFEWDQYTKLSPTFKRNLRQLFSELDFAGRVEDAPLLESVVFLQDLFKQGKSPRQTNPLYFPVSIISKRVRPYLYSKIKGKRKQLETDRYEFLVYRLLSNALEAGDIFVKDSLEFRRFEDDLISDARWQDKDAVLREIGSPILMTPIKDTLALLYDELETKFEAVNYRINNNLNEHIKVFGKAEKRRWTLMYPNAEEPVNNPFYGQLPGVGIADLLTLN